jgi:transposase InsO family protein
MRFAFIAAEKATYPVTRLCRCLQVTPSGFYAWATRGLSARAQRDVVLRTKLRAFHAASGHRYGRPNLWKDLQEDGEAVSEKRVARLMREEGIRGKVRRRFKNTTMSDHTDPIAPNVLARDFTAAGPNQRWVSDTSEFRIGNHGKLYLAAILDLYSRFVVGWAVSAVNDRQLTLKALEMAVQRRCPARLAASLGSRLHLYLRGLPDVSSVSRHQLQHEPPGQLLRQRGDGGLLLDGQA